MRVQHSFPPRASSHHPAIDFLVYFTIIKCTTRRLCVRVRRVARLYGPDRCSVQAIVDGAGGEQQQHVGNDESTAAVRYGRDNFQHGVYAIGSVLAVQQRKNRSDGRGVDCQQRQHVRFAHRSARGGRHAAAAVVVTVFVRCNRHGVHFGVERHEQPEQMRPRIFQGPDGPMPANPQTAFAVSI